MLEKKAPYYDHIYSFLDYRAAADTLRALISEHHPGARSLLDVACGSGKHLDHLRQHYRVEGLDLLPAMLDHARARCPDVPLHQGDMTDFSLGREFDVVSCLFCSIGLVVTLEKAERAIARMAAHLAPGGLLIVEPWITPEQCWTHKVTSESIDTPGLRIARMYAYEMAGRTSVYDIHYLVGTPAGVTHFTEREVRGLFTHEEYVAAFNKAGLSASYFDMGLFPGHEYGLYLGRKPP